MNIDLSQLNLISFQKSEDKGAAESGFTLVEALVAVAITGILAVVLTRTINQVSTATRSNEALASSLTSLNIAAQDIAQKLRNAGRSNVTLPAGVEFEFVGKDGDGSFNTTDVVDERPTDATDYDRLFFHVMDTDQDLGGNVASERTGLGFFLSDKETSLYAAGEWRLYRKRKTHDPDANTAMPSLPDDITDLSGAQAMGIDVDRLQFQYLDSSGNWTNTWDSSSSGNFPKAVEIGLRSYDTSDESAPGHVDPQWYVTMVSLDNE